MSTTLRVDRTYPHPRALVWRALVDRDLLAQWLMPNDFEPRVGHRFTFRTEPGPGFDGVVRCEVLEIIDQERLVLAWAGGPIDTRITFTLADAPGGCRLVVEQVGFKGLRAWIVSRILAIGSRTIYGRRLPEVLASLDAPRTGPPPGACMSPGQRIWEWWLRVLYWRNPDGKR
ncbi:MAG: SRPBCC domain-containing protein [Phycisphaerales bacterium]|nr:SRPBCC domain-containing protein [Phycisphaerales bacterium]